jgi:hypothetical protein
MSRCRTYFILNDHHDRICPSISGYAYRQNYFLGYYGFVVWKVVQSNFHILQNPLKCLKEEFHQLLYTYWHTGTRKKDAF